jgi:hypothetical protein
MNIMSSLKSPYRYETLDAQNKSLRLLTMDRSITNRITCSLEVVELIHAPEYIALSYTWGAPSPCRQICIDGCSSNVRLNLWTALNTLAIHGLPKDLPDDTRHFWIDAICINQEDIDERNQQVAIMGEIFSQAKCVITWLGEADSHTSDFFMDYMSNIDLYTGQVAREFISQVPKETFSKVRDTHLMDTIWGHPYWTRVWIVQEIVLAKEVVVLCGTKSCKYNQLVGMWYWDITNITWLSKVDVGRLEQCLHSIFHLRRLWLESGGEEIKKSICSLIDGLSWQGCTDVRDKIFGLIGILSISMGSLNEGVEQYRPDYRQTVINVYSGFVEYLNILRISQTQSESERAYFIVNLAIAMGLQPCEVYPHRSVQKFVGDTNREYEEFWRGHINLDSWKTNSRYQATQVQASASSDEIRED